MVTSATKTWNVSSGSWEVASNWAPSGEPGPEDTAVVSSGIVVFSGS